MKEDYIKLIFGLKLKQVRSDSGLSLYGLAKKTGLSKSYLNEIEKGKKYPKPDRSYQKNWMWLMMTWFP